MVRKAVAAGGTTYKEPQDHGFMYADSSRNTHHYGWGIDDHYFNNWNWDAD